MLIKHKCKNKKTENLSYEFPNSFKLYNYTYAGLLKINKIG